MAKTDRKEENLILLYRHNYQVDWVNNLITKIVIQQKNDNGQDNKHYTNNTEMKVVKVVKKFKRWMLVI